MAGISLGPSHPRPCSGEKTLRRCKYNEEADEITLIDVDSENFDNVIIIDIPDSLSPKKNEGSNMLRKDKWPFINVINIDDDETPDNTHFAGTSSNRESIRVAQNYEDSVEDCQFVQDKSTPFRLSKCKRTYSGNFFRRNRYGLDTASECESSDDDGDYPDCELVEDTSGKVQEEWERAFSRRRKDINNGHSGTRGKDIKKETQQNAKSKDGTRQHKEASSLFSETSIDEIDAESFYRKKVDTKSRACGRSKFQAKFCPPVHVEPGNSCGHIDERRENPSTSNFASREESTKNFDHPIPIVEDEEPSEVGPTPPKPVKEDSCIGNSGPVESETTTFKSKSSFEREINQGRSFPKDNHGNIKEMDNVMPRSKLPGKRTDISPTPSYDAVDDSGKSLFPESVMHSVEGKEGNHKESSPPVSEIPLFGSEQVMEAKLQEDESMSNVNLQENNDDLPSKNEDTEETCIISDREKQKETDEYKRAVEQEWASRQQALQIQSEEARRQRQLRKRRRAESMRLMDMERRQKERIEEVRNIQKKDEENMNLKETIRGEVRNELKKVEAQCKDMAWLLNSLGIQVGSWPKPSPQEVQTAYKRAMLTFHPDRALQSDIRKQVEAEEKFKLVNRIKEKLCVQGKWVVA